MLRFLPALCLLIPGLCLRPALALPTEKPAGRLETVATFSGPMPTGVTVSRGGRIFVNFPRWGDRVPYTVAELRGGRAVPYPNPEVNRYDPARIAECFVSVQSVVVDPKDRLWILDTGSIQFGRTSSGGPKLIGVDLKTNRIVKKILFPPRVALPTSYLNDVRFDLRRGRAGYAFITDSSSKGPNALIVVDLATGQARRRLEDHPSLRAEPRFLPLVEGRMLMNRPPNAAPSHLSVGVDGIALRGDGKRLFYCPLASRRLYSIEVDALINPDVLEDRLEQLVVDHGEKGGGSDGLEADDRGRIYLTQYEHNAILRRYPNGLYETLVRDPRLLWPDTLSLAENGYLYVIANQLHRQPGFHRGYDRREKPYSLFRIKTDARPVRLR